MDLDANLVVLSACDTSLGGHVPGEGMVALPQAFLMAGARSIIASLWPVDDEATTAFMGILYGNLMGGMPPARALYETRRELRKMPKYSDPYYRGAFVLFGGG